MEAIQTHAANDHNDGPDMKLCREIVDESMDNIFNVQSQVRLKASLDSLRPRNVGWYPEVPKEEGGPENQDRDRMEVFVKWYDSSEFYREATADGNDNGAHIV